MDALEIAPEKPPGKQRVTVETPQPDGIEALSELTRIATESIGRGDASTAAPILLRAIEISERHPATERPELALLLNDLSRLCLKQSAYAQAEPLLLKLFDLKRSKGEDHPEVATVLASLATVRQALGHHESAEQLWRRVLAIRERTLAPNHFAVATALERLADSCAARGKLAEALELYKRALTMREHTLGGDHASLRISRERIGDLQLQASEEPLEGEQPSNSAPVVAPPFAYSARVDFVPPLQPPPKVRHIDADPSAGAKAALSQGMSNSSAPAALATPSMSMSPVFTELKPMAMTTVEQTGGAPSFRDLVLSIEKDLDDETAERDASATLAAFVARVTTVLRTRRNVAAVAAGAVIFLLVALAADSRVGVGAEVSRAQAGEVSGRVNAPSGPVAGATGTIGSVGIAAVAKQPSESSRSTIANFVAPHAKPSETKTERRNEEKSSAPAKVAIPKVSQSLMATSEAIAKSINTPASPLGDLGAVQPVPLGNHSKLWNSEPETSNAPQRARLIGALPTPRIPEAVSDVTGVVKVWFRVDTTGHPIMSSFTIENSPSPLVTSAVKKVIPDLRFEPARTAGPNSRAAMDSVQIGFTFRDSH